MFSHMGGVNKAEVNKNPDGKSTLCGVIEFKTKEDADVAVNQFNPRQYSWDGYYVKKLGYMVWPDVCDGCATLSECKNE